MKLVYVNAYDRNRAYGGPEEGGWWFETGHLLASIPVMIGDLPRTSEQDDKAIEEAKQTLHELYDAAYSGPRHKRHFQRYLRGSPRSISRGLPWSRLPN